MYIYIYIQTHTCGGRRTAVQASGIHWNSSKAALLGTVGELRSVGSDYYAATRLHVRDLKVNLNFR